MKHFIGFVVLLVLPLSAGCSKQTPPSTAGKTTQPALIPEGLNERHAATRLAGARHLQETGESEQAVEVLNEIVADYPESDAADEATKLLSELEERNIDTVEAEDGGVVQDPDRE